MPGLWDRGDVGVSLAASPLPSWPLEPMRSRLALLRGPASFHAVVTAARTTAAAASAGCRTCATLSLPHRRIVWAADGWALYADGSERYAAAILHGQVQQHHGPPGELVVWLEEWLSSRVHLVAIGHPGQQHHRIYYLEPIPCP